MFIHLGYLATNALCHFQTEDVGSVKEQAAGNSTDGTDKKMCARAEDTTQQTPKESGVLPRRENVAIMDTHSKKSLESPANNLKSLPATTLDRRRTAQGSRCVFVNSRVADKPPRDTLSNSNAQSRKVNFHAASTLTPMQSFRNVSGGLEYNLNPDLLPRLEYKHGVVTNLAWHNKGIVRCCSSNSSSTDSSGTSQDSSDGEE